MDSYSLDNATAAYQAAMERAVRKYAVLYIAQGLLLILAGLLAIFYPLTYNAAIAVPLGWVLVATAVLQAVALVVTWQLRLPYFSTQLASIAVALLVGYLLLRNPQQALDVITLLVIVFLMIQGVVRLSFGLVIRPFRNWLWAVLSGVLGIFLALVLIISLPTPPVWAIALVLGLELIGEGVAVVALAWNVAVPEGTTGPTTH